MCFCVLLLVDMSYLYEHMILSFMAVLFFAYVIGDIYVHYNSVFFMYAWMVGMCLTSYPICLYLCMCISFLDPFIYACVKGELHLKFSPKIFMITIFVLSLSKRGRLLA